MQQTNKHLFIFSSSYAVGSLMTPKKLRIAKALGFGSILNTLPKANSILADIQAFDFGRHAIAANMEYRQFEIAHIHDIDDDMARAFRTLLRELPKPILAFSRTGERAAAIWAKAMAPEIGADEVRQAVRRSGFELPFFDDDLADAGARAA